ncbi:MAG: tetratricopeptide repeat protein [Chitinophagales bacterium]|nr:tetratricopeptide repeat protein [Chitinophagales bacterium]MCO5280508.1 tetratricopeptide repeat protein [Chitinophagales bacterium]HRP40095.1 tetratricopeptide repeat protein [Chitinophagales bacterium]
MRKIFFTAAILFIGWNGFAAPEGKHEEAFHKGEVEFSNGRYEEALKYFNMAISETQDRYKYFYMRALANKQMELTDDAIADFSRAIRLKPTTEAMYERGIMLFNNGDMDAAKGDFEDVKIAKDNFKNIQYYLGVVYYRAGVYEHALKAFNRYLSATGGDGDTYYYKGLVNASIKHYEDAISDLNKALPYKKNNLLIYVKLYELYIQTNQPEKAVESISAMIDLSPQNKRSELYMERSLLYGQLGNIELSNSDRLKSREAAASIFN